MHNRHSVLRPAAVMVLSMLLALSSGAAESTKPIKVFLLGGQSNMMGSDKASNLKAPYQQPLPAVTIWHHPSETWVPLSPVAVNRRGRFGPEITFGHALADRHAAGSIRLVKYAASGTALYNDWSPVVKGRQYLAFMKLAKAALADLDASGIAYEMAGMLWLQGESDAQEGRGDAYEKNISDFIAHMREAFNAPDMPFVIARVRDHYGRKSGHAKFVRDAQAAVCKSMPNVAWFDTDDCAMLNAGHYNAEGLSDIGKRFADTYTKMMADQ